MVLGIDNLCMHLIAVIKVSMCPLFENIRGFGSQRNGDVLIRGMGPVCWKSVLR